MSRAFFPLAQSRKSMVQYQQWHDNRMNKHGAPGSLVGRSPVFFVFLKGFLLLRHARCRAPERVERMVPPMSATLALLFGLLVAIVVLAALASRLRIPYAILLVLGGLVLGFVPGLPRLL